MATKRPPPEVGTVEDGHKYLGGDPADQTNWEEVQDQGQQGLLSKLWGLASVPEQKSKQGFDILSKMIPNVEPTGNTFRDMAVNTPSILGQSVAETAGKVAPGFVSPLAMATSGGLAAVKAASPLIESAGSLIGKGAEAISGLEYKTPGILGEAMKDPSLIFGRGLDAAREMYSEAKGAPGAIRETLTDAGGKVLDAGKKIGDIRKEFQAPLSHEDFITKALQAAEDGTLTPDEALEARKSTDAIKKRLTGEGFRRTREIFDSIAKKTYSAADSQYGRSIKSEALRTLFPVNKGGGTSIFKTSLLGALVPPLAPLASPAVQGGIASGLGAVGKGALLPYLANPILGAGISPAIKAYQSLFDSMREQNNQ